MAIAFFAALTGSLHCVVMCGPIRLLTGNSKGPRIAYQGGRIVGYLSLGALAGFFGKTIPIYILLPLLLLGISFSFLPNLRLPWAQKIRQKILKWSSTQPFLLGLSSALLPCGLLHAWLSVAALSASPLSGALVLFVLWVGTLPALEASAGLLLQPIKKIRAHFPRATTATLLFLALLPMAWRFSFQFSTKSPQENAGTCPMHAKHEKN